MKKVLKVICGIFAVIGILFMACFLCIRLTYGKFQFVGLIKELSGYIQPFM